MTDPDDRLLDELAALDPTGTDAPPTPGSVRHTETLERAMTTTRSDEDQQPDLRPHVDDGHRSARRWKPRVLAASVVAAIVIGAVTVLVTLEPDRELTPAAAVTEAADRTGDELTLRSEFRQDDDAGGLSIIRSEHRGGDVRRRFSAVDAQGEERNDVESDEVTTFIGDTGWIVDGDEITEVDVPRDERNAPYAVASAAIVDAAVTESTVTEVGEEDVRGTATTHYRIDLDEAAIRRLEALPTNQRSGFELEYPSNVRSLDVWIGDGYLRRIRVIQEFEGPDSPGTTVEFYDFGAAITIEPPT